MNMMIVIINMMMKNINYTYNINGKNKKIEFSGIFNFFIGESFIMNMLNL